MSSSQEKNFTQYVQLSRKNLQDILTGKKQKKQQKNSLKRQSKTKQWQGFWDYETMNLKQL